jgi:hypothetical protein
MLGYVHEDVGVWDPDACRCSIGLQCGRLATGPLDTDSRGDGLGWYIEPSGAGESGMMRALFGSSLDSWALVTALETAMGTPEVVERTGLLS